VEGEGRADEIVNVGAGLEKHGVLLEKELPQLIGVDFNRILGGDLRHVLHGHDGGVLGNEEIRFRQMKFRH
jgi:hypothetical protein